MAIYCDPSCAPPAITAVGTIGCTPVLRNNAFKRLVFIRCDADPATLLPTSGEGGVDAADIITALATLYGGGTASEAFVSPTGIRTGLEQEDPTEVKLDGCGKVAYVDGALTVTMEFKYGWDNTPVAVSPAVDENPEDVFWKALKKSFASWNYGFVDCNGVLGYFMNPAETTFASGIISVKDLDEEVNDCNTFTKKEVKITFKCGASLKKIATLLDPDHDELIAWA